MARNPTIGYRPSDEALKFIESYCGKNSTLSRPQLIEIALKFLMNWPKEEIQKIIGRSYSGKEMREYIDSVIEVKKG